MIVRKIVSVAKTCTRLTALNLCVYAARANGLDVIDGVQLDLENEELVAKAKVVKVESHKKSAAMIIHLLKLRYRYHDRYS